MNVALGLAVGVAVSALSVWALRYWLAMRPAPTPPTEAFDGTEHRVGECRVFERKCDAPRATVVCMPGYLEMPHYFTRYYEDPTLQLVLVTSADYAQPFHGQKLGDATWVSAPTSEVGSIEYDAEALALVLQHLPRTSKLRVHGHSRGGAVVVEAARRRPELFESAEVVLETPVLPQGRLATPLSAFALWIWPVVMLAWRRQPISPQNAASWGRLDDARKKQLIVHLPNNPRRALTAERNVRSIVQWSSATSGEVLAKVRGIVVIADDDRVLDSAAMRASAERAPNLTIVDAKSSSHFPLFDAPHVFPPI